MTTVSFNRNDPNYCSACYKMNTRESGKARTIRTDYAFCAKHEKKQSNSIKKIEGVVKKRKLISTYSLN
jgi:hypothetical protein